MSQIHSALAYYWDYKQELDLDMQRRMRDRQWIEIDRYN
jgi:hypothetical protein